MDPVLCQERLASSRSSNPRAPEEPALLAFLGGSILLALPHKFLEQIIDYLKHVNDPTLFMLRCTHRLFYSMISLADVRGHPWQSDLLKQYRLTEVARHVDGGLEHFLPGHFASLSCLQLPQAFTDAASQMFYSERFCLACGLRHQNLLPGEQMMICGELCNFYFYDGTLHPLKHTTGLDLVGPSPMDGPHWLDLAIPCALLLSEVYIRGVKDLSRFKNIYPF